MAGGKSVAAAKAQMPLPERDVSVPDRAMAALTKQTLVKEWGIPPWELDRVSVRDLQDVMLAEHASSFIEYEQQQQYRTGGMRSTRRSDSYQEYEDRMRDKFGGIH